MPAIREVSEREHSVSRSSKSDNGSVSRSISHAGGEIADPSAPLAGAGSGDRVEAELAVGADGDDPVSATPMTSVLIDGAPAAQPNPSPASPASAAVSPATDPDSLAGEGGNEEIDLYIPISNGQIALQTFRYYLQANTFLFAFGYMLSSDDLSDASPVDIYMRVFLSFLVIPLVGFNLLKRVEDEDSTACSRRLSLSFFMMCCDLCCLPFSGLVLGCSQLSNSLNIYKHLPTPAADGVLGSLVATFYVCFMGIARLANKGEDKNHILFFSNDNGGDREELSYAHAIVKSIKEAIEMMLTTLVTHRLAMALGLGTMTQVPFIVLPVLAFCNWTLLNLLTHFSLTRDPIAHLVPDAWMNEDSYESSSSQIKKAIGINFVLRGSSLFVMIGVAFLLSVQKLWDAEHSASHNSQQENVLNAMSLLAIFSGVILLENMLRARFLRSTLFTPPSLRAAVALETRAHVGPDPHVLPDNLVGTRTDLIDTPNGVRIVRVAK